MTIEQLNEMTVAELKVLAEENSIDVSSCNLKADYVNAIASVLCEGETVAEEESRFTREQLRKSKKFAQYKDIVAVVLKEGESYTLEQCEALVNEFLNKKYEKVVE